MRHEALKFLGLPETRPTFEEMKAIYPDYFRAYIHKAVELELLDPKLALYDLDALGKALLTERDGMFDYLGLRTLYDRYFIHSNKTRFELPQAFFMRVAMGLAMNEIDREARAIEFYTLLSSRSEEHTSELQSLMRISYAVFCLKTKNQIHYEPLHAPSLQQRKTPSHHPHPTRG